MPASLRYAVCIPMSNGRKAIIFFKDKDEAERYTVPKANKMKEIKEYIYSNHVSD